MLRLALLALLLAPAALAQPEATTTPAGPLAIEIDGETVDLRPLRAAAVADGFVVLAKRRERTITADYLVALRLGLDGSIAEHRVLSEVGVTLNDPTRLKARGDALVFAIQVNEPEQNSPVRIVSLNGVDASVLATVPTGTTSSTEAVGEGPDAALRISSRSFRVSDLVPAGDDLFFVSGQAHQSVEVIRPGEPFGDRTTDTEPVLALANTTGAFQKLQTVEVGHGEVMGVAVQPDRILAAFWTNETNSDVGPYAVQGYDTALAPTLRNRIDFAAYRFAEIHTWGEGFLLYGATGSDGDEEQGPSRLYLLVLTPNGSGGLGADVVEIGGDLPREGQELTFRPGFLATVGSQGVMAAATVQWGEEGTIRRQVYLGRPGSGPEDRWEMRIGTPVNMVVPLAIHPRGVVLAATLAEIGAPYVLEVTTLTE